MSRYFFNYDKGPYPQADEGVDLEGPDEARAVAVFHAGEALRDASKKFWDGPEWRLLVTDEQGATVCSLSITGVVGRP